MPFDALNPADLVLDELRQLTETAYETGAFEAAVREAGALDRSSSAAILARHGTPERRPGWRYVEPTELAAILRTLPAVPAEQPAMPEDYADRILAAWTGRVLGCMLGKPIEDGLSWTAARIREYLLLAEALPLRDFIPALDPMPAGFEFRPCWVQTTRGRVDGSARDDDIDYTIVNLEVLEQHGPGFTTRDIADAWLSRLPVLQVYTAERAAYRNLINGLEPPDTAAVDNPYREWIGAQIRADVFGYVCPGRPRAAALMAYRDAALSHTGNGIYAEMWAAALIATALHSDSAAACLGESLQHIPPQSRLSEALVGVVEQHRRGVSWRECLDHIQQTVGHYPWVHAVNNSCLLAAALLWGENDYLTTISLTVQGGWDTDSNGATAGSVMGALLGTGALPQHMAAPLGDRVRSAVFGFDNCSLAELAARTVRLGQGAFGAG